MKRFLPALLAFTMLAVPVAQAAPRDPGPGPRMVERQAGPAHSVRHFDRKVVVKKKVVVKPRWHRGQRVPAWQRGPVVRDYGRYGLRRPAHGQHWVRVGNDYLLIGITSGIIAGLIAGR